MCPCLLLSKNSTSGHCCPRRRRRPGPPGTSSPAASRLQPAFSHPQNKVPRPFRVPPPQRSRRNAWWTPRPRPARSALRTAQGLQAPPKKGTGYLSCSHFGAAAGTHKTTAQGQEGRHLHRQPDMQGAQPPPGLKWSQAQGGHQPGTCQGKGTCPWDVHTLADESHRLTAKSQPSCFSTDLSPPPQVLNGR